MDARLIERDSAMEACEESVGLAASGTGNSVIVRGGAGSGKTALLDWTASHANDQGAVVLRFRGSHAAHDLPFNAATNILTSLGAELSVDIIGLMHEFLSAEAEAAAVLGGHPPAPSTTHAHYRGIVRELVTTLDALTERAAGRPVILVIDNLHWLDRPSMEWLSVLLERLHTMPLSLVATICDGLQGTDADLLDELAVASMRRISLKPLGRTGIADFLELRTADQPHPSFVDAALMATAGNPLLLDTLATLMQDRGLRCDEHGAAAVPTLTAESLALSLRVRLRRVSPDALPTFRIAAVMDGDATVRTIAELSGIPEADISDSCHAMQRLGLLSDDASRIVVTQPLLAASILQDSSPAVVRAVHVQAANLLHAFGAPDHRVAAHLLFGNGPVDEPWMVTTLLAAARTALSENTPSAAIGYLQRALEGPLEVHGQVAALVDLASATAHVDMPGAARIIDRAVKLDPEAAGRYMNADLLALLTLDECREGVESAWHALTAARRAEIGPDALLVHRLTADTPPPLFRQPRWPEPTAGLSAPILQAWAVADAAGPIDRAVSLARRAAHGPTHSLTQLLRKLGAARILTMAGEIKEASALGDEVARAAESRKMGSVLAITLVWQAHTAARAGLHDAAAEHVHRSLRLLDEGSLSGQPKAASAVLARAVTTLLDIGAVDDALRLFHEGQLDSAVKATSTSKGSSAMTYAIGRLRMEEDNPRGAAEAFISYGKALTDAGVLNPATAPWRSQAAAALAQAQDTEGARSLLEEELALASQWGAPGAMAEAMLTQSMLLEGHQAISTLQGVVELLRPSEERALLAATFHRLGASLADVDLSGARDALRECYALAAAASNHELMAHVRGELQSLGGRPPRLRRQGVDGLTTSERRVVNLASRGRKNREIAAELFVQQRTVEIHLSNAYRKLGIAGRDELKGVLNHLST
ncbi:AAA family ATPase [Streptomyces sp. NPDC001833]|uniref:ATP-binding protein n=1 Tax=Streptomyces sp. NPDC001833 TaxID=3154658 RepID=UPI0033334271